MVVTTDKWRIIGIAGIIGVVLLALFLIWIFFLGGARQFFKIADAGSERIVTELRPDSSSSSSSSSTTLTDGQGGGITTTSNGSGEDYVGTTWALNKCAWLRQNFPQTDPEVHNFGAQLAKVDSTRIRPHTFTCAKGSSAYDGFIVLGPREAKEGMVTLTVPDHGAIDSYSGATYSGRHELIGAQTDTVRAFDGTVTGLSMTYWPYLDEDPPTASRDGNFQAMSTGASNPPIDSAASSNASTDPAASEEACMTGRELAKKMGWKVYDAPESVTKYGGIRVAKNLKESDLPAGWEVISQGGGVSSIYPPHGACRDQLKVLP